jgi:hypothetical protein
MNRILRNCFFSYFSNHLVTNHFPRFLKNGQNNFSLVISNLCFGSLSGEHGHSYFHAGLVHVGCLPQNRQLPIRLYAMNFFSGNLPGRIFRNIRKFPENIHRPFVHKILWRGFCSAYSIIYTVWQIKVYSNAGCCCC